MAYVVKFTKAALKGFRKLPEQARKQVSKKLTKLADAPFDRYLDVKKLQGVNGGYRLRCGDYRVIYAIDDNVLIVTVVKIAHRKEVYK